MPLALRHTMALLSALPSSCKRWWRALRPRQLRRGVEPGNGESVHLRRHGPEDRCRFREHWGAGRRRVVVNKWGVDGTSGRTAGVVSQHRGLGCKDETHAHAPGQRLPKPQRCNVGMDRHGVVETHSTSRFTEVGRRLCTEAGWHGAALRGFRRAALLEGSRAKLVRRD